MDRARHVIQIICGLTILPMAVDAYRYDGRLAMLCLLMAVNFTLYATSNLTPDIPPAEPAEDAVDLEWD